MNQILARMDEPLQDKTPKPETYFVVPKLSIVDAAAWVKAHVSSIPVNIEVKNEPNGRNKFHQADTSWESRSELETDTTPDDGDHVVDEMNKENLDHEEGQVIEETGLRVVSAVVNEPRPTRKRKVVTENSTLLAESTEALQTYSNERSVRSKTAQKRQA